MKYTVLLLYPDYHADTYGENWCGSVEAPDVIEAVRAAQKQCVADNKAEDYMDPDDLQPIAIFEGEQHDLISDWLLSIV